MWMKMNWNLSIKMLGESFSYINCYHACILQVINNSASIFYTSLYFKTLHTFWIFTATSDMFSRLSQLLAFLQAFSNSIKLNHIYWVGSSTFSYFYNFCFYFSTRNNPSTYLSNLNFVLNCIFRGGLKPLRFTNDYLSLCLKQKLSSN